MTDKDIKETDPALPKPEAPKGDQITNVIGDVGRWQIEKVLLVFIVAAPGLAHIFHSAFITPKTKFWCGLAKSSETGETYTPYDYDEVQHIHHDNGTDEHIYPNITGICWNKWNETEDECVDYHHDHSFWVSTMITEWDLVCEKLALKTLAKTILFTGFALGSFSAGLVSDRFGRKTAVWGASVTMCVFGLITSFIPWYEVFVFTWWVTGTMAIACYTAAFVWVMELATGKWKIYLGMSMNYSWPFCRLVIAGLAYGLRDWHWHLRAISGMVGVGTVLMFFVPESPRWLIARDRIDEAKEVLYSAAKRNNLNIEKEQIVLKRPTASGAKGSFLDIMRHPTLRMHTLIMYFNWFTTAFIMYGLALSWQDLTGGLFLNFIIGTLLDFPAKTLAMLMVQHVGRKYPYMAGSAITGLMFLCTLFIERDVYPSNWPIVVFALIGNFSTTMCFAILYMYTGELMPTTVRAAGVGSSSLVSKVGGTMSTTVSALAEVHVAIPTLIFVALALTSSAITWFVPETKDRKMPETIDDIERLKCCGR